MPQIKKMVHKLIDKMEDIFHVERSYVFGKTRRREIIELRMMMYALMREDLGYTLPKIGKIFNRDHSSVIHLLKQHENQLETDKTYSSKWSEFKGKMCGHIFDEQNVFFINVLSSVEDCNSIKDRILVLKNSFETYKLNNYGESEMV